jgi:ATP-dependent RNA helicase DeaD
VEKVPTVADLRAHRLELVRATLRETLLGGDLERFRVVVESLAEEFDPMQVAMAAVKLAQAGTGGEMDGEEIVIPDVRPPEQRAAKGASGRGGGGAADAKGGRRRVGAPQGELVRIYVGAGRDAGVAPKDLVGAITGESSVKGDSIGAIEITERFSLVEVSESVAGEVLRALRNTTIKGRKVKVRKDRARRD